MFDSLSDRLSEAFKNFKGQGRLDEKNIQAGLREVRLALLEADVNYKVVKDFVEKVKERALGQEVQKSLSPGQQVIKVVNDELTELLGGEQEGLQLTKGKLSKIMMVGLQGSGKTTSSAKIALYLRRKKFKPYLVPADVYRPAAIDQLHVLAKQLDMPAYPSTTEMNPVDICRDAMVKAEEAGCDVLLFDTAGRLHIDEPLMEELSSIKEHCSPDEILFVADAMTGQDAVNVASTFDDKLDVTGVVLTKMDGDARGGAALSIKSVTGKSVKFVGVGEKLSELELFYPDRAASRILGMGDVLSLIEKAQSVMDEGEAEKLTEKFRKAEFDLEDFRTQMRRMKKIGSMGSIMKMIPGLGGLTKQLGDMEIPDKELNRIEAIISSMTMQERRQPKLINPSRRQRIAKGSGVKLEEVNQMLKNFEQMSKMMKKMMGGKGGKGKMPKMPNLPGMPGLGGGAGMPGMPGMEGLEGMEGMGGMPQPSKAKSKKTLQARKKKKLKKQTRKKKKK
ncbi:signal recognition particle protein [Maridesulfovibrio salexigens]|uniref:Signal recognition particle protein n=1 Tax=Maridesulfovibrio salexigens (strain ATCC 14822 / DSM 2638 / NCIMB 8403 / VKM B-1763) TaxID=526222 RepID=C6BVQ0_MARSD|nr:signal recognition particle protein [Maridesulfovibrio salexigens]ACS78264.1 signal recognition particle protein [Maridesulfovibrio salexigens DSM 2638]